MTVLTISVAFMSVSGDPEPPYGDEGKCRKHTCQDSEKATSEPKRTMPEKPTRYIGFLPNLLSGDISRFHVLPIQIQQKHHNQQTDLSLMPPQKKEVVAKPTDIAATIVELIVSVVPSFFSNVVNKYARISKKRPVAKIFSCSCKNANYNFVEDASL